MSSNRPTKRSKPSTSSHTTPASLRDPLFAAFRSLGHISTHVPFVLQSRSSKNLESPKVSYVTSLGNSWAMWDGEGLKLVFVGPALPEPITSLAISLDSVFAAYGNKVGRYIRGKQVGTFVLNQGKSGSSESDSESESEEEEEDDEMAASSDDSDDSDDEDVRPTSSPTPTTLTSLLLFGSTLLSLSSTGRHLHVWDIPLYTKAASIDPATTPALAEGIDAEAGEKVVTPYTTIEFPAGFVATKMVHPASYLNKVVVGSEDGQLAVWNVRTGTLLHTFSPTSFSLRPSLSSLSSSSTTQTEKNNSITSLVQSPAIDVLGIGFASGDVVLFDVRMGEVLGKVRVEDKFAAGFGESGSGLGEVTGVVFRADPSAQTLSISTSSGHLAFFDLSNKLKLIHILKGAHEGGVSGMEWLDNGGPGGGQGVVVTSGKSDNSLKQWLFESPTSTPRLLRSRSGHHAPPSLVRYYGEDGKGLLTAGGEDRALRYTSVVRDSRGYELSQGSIERQATRKEVKQTSLKLPSITNLSWSSSRAREWDDVVTVSEGEKVGRSWSVLNKKVGKWTMAVEGSVTTSAVTACGNFGLVGSTEAQVVMYNLQSGMKRKIFNVPNGGAGDVRGRKVVGVAVDSLNRVVIVATLKGGVHFFDFQTMKLVKSISVPASVTSILLQRDNGLFAIVCDDLTVRIVDIETYRIVRELSGFRGRILDLAFSPDSRWIITTSQDSIVRTFDIPTGQLVDAFRTASVATSLAFSPTSDFLATTHVDSVGVYLWANRAQFSEVSLRAFVDTGLEEVALPTVQGADVEGLSELKAPQRWEDVQPYTTPDQLTTELLTLSLMPRSRWQTLLNLETIKQRNKPKEAPKAPERAPFFLPTLPGVEQRFDFGTSEKDGASDAGEAKKSRRILDLASNSVETEFVRRMLKEERSGDYQAFFEYLKSLSPSATDLELRSLTTLPHLSAFLHALNQRLTSHKDFEAVQTFLAYFLRIHGDVLVQNVELTEDLKKVATSQEKEGKRLRELVGYTLGTLAFLRSVPVA